MMSTNVMSSQHDNSHPYNIDSSVLFKNHEVITKQVNASSSIPKLPNLQFQTKQQRIHFDSSSTIIMNDRQWSEDYQNDHKL